MWAGLPQGTAEDLNRCVVSVSDHTSWPHSGQCKRRRGHGPSGLYCKQHARMLVGGLDHSFVFFVPPDE